jgi:hypothetical protein
LVDYQAGVLQNLQMLGDRGAANRERAGELTDGSRAIAQQLKDRFAGRIPERGPAVGVVSGH